MVVRTPICLHILRYRCVTDSGRRGVVPSGSSEKTKASGLSSAPNARARATQRRRCSTINATVPKSSTTRRSECVLVLCSSHRSAPICPIRRSRWRTPFTRSRCRHRIAQSSPRRRPITMVSQTSVPQSGSFQASSMISAASLGRGRPRVGRLDRRRLGQRHWVGRNPVPTLCPPECTGQDPVDLPHRPLRQRPTSVRGAASVTDVGPTCPVINPPNLPVAVVAAPKQL